ncbi:SLAM family member 5-like [Sylvia atricapilla]|uniref:SLAM family member 5-like n=1 Tax=Sylvia atricapilla TaxID=48155 RepID=UPI003390F494
MEEFWIQLLAILTLLTQTCSASDTTELIRAVGGAVTFRIDNTEGNAARWSVGDDPIVTVEFGNPPRPVFYQDKFKTRFTVSEDGRALSISQLRMEDAGTYSVTSGRKKSTFTLLVYRELPEPTVTCEAEDCLNSICLLSLLCSVPRDGFGNVSYTWTGWGLRWGEKSAVLALVDKSSWHNLEPLRCTARNAVSSRSVTVTNPGGLCPAGNSTHLPGPGAPSSSGVWIGIAVGVSVVMVILSGFLILLFRSRGYWPWRRVGEAAQLGFLPLLEEVIGTVATPQLGRDLHQDRPRTSSDHHWDRPQSSSLHHQHQPQTSSDQHQHLTWSNSDPRWQRPRTRSVQHWHVTRSNSDPCRHWTQTSMTHSVPSATTWQGPDSANSPMETLVDMSPSALKNSENNQFLEPQDKPRNTNSLPE